jgi:glucokinase
MSHHLSQEKALLLGLEIGGTKLQLVAAETPRDMVLRQRIALPPRTGAADILQHISTALEAWKGVKWKAAGIGFGGPVDWPKGTVHCSHHIAGWDGMDLCGWLSTSSLSDFR